MTDIEKKDEPGMLQPEETKTVVVREKKAVAKTKEQGTGSKGPWMYVGPTVPGIGIQNRVYTKIPEGVQEQIGQVPEIGHLFILIKDYPMANRMLREGTGYISDAYCKVIGIERGGNRT